MLGDGIFDAVDAGVRGVAEVVLDPAAEVVAVVAGAVAPGGAHQDHAPVDALLQAALSAPDGALQVVVVALAAFGGEPSGGQDCLDAVEEIVGDDAFVPAGVKLAFVADFAEVVAVAEQLLDLGFRDGSGGPAGGGPGEESAVGEFVGDVLVGLVASGVEFEGELHERGALWIDLDGVDLASVEQVLHVKVAERRPSERAAVLGFLAHLVSDVGAIGGGAVLVERGQHAMHQLAFGRGVDVLGRRDQRHTALLEVGHDDGVVDPVAGEAGQLVHDDVIDVAFATDAFQHLLEPWPFGDVGARAARFDVLLDDAEPKLFGLALAGNALSRDGDALWVVVRVHLPLRGDAQVDDGTTAAWGIGRVLDTRFVFVVLVVSDGGRDGQERRYLVESERGVIGLGRRGRRGGENS